jgi:hypothetical protein
MEIRKRAVWRARLCERIIFPFEFLPNNNPQGRGCFVDETPSGRDIDNSPMMRDDYVAIMFPLCVGIFSVTIVCRLKAIQQKTGSWLEADGVMLDIAADKWGRVRHAYARYEYYAPNLQVGTRICPYGCEESDPGVYLRRYPKGGKIVVRYDPSNPQECYLELPVGRGIKLWSALSTMCFTFPLIYHLWLVYLE